jgi:hypothetical protein
MNMVADLRRGERMLRERYSFVTVLLALSFLLIQCGRTKQTQHIGEWSGVDSTGAVGNFVFEKNGTGKMTVGDTFATCKYEIDYSKRPIWLGVILTQNGQEVRIKMIVEFLDRNTMRLRTFFDESRPIEFLEKDPKHTIVLSRVGA